MKAFESPAPEVRHHIGPLRPAVGGAEFLTLTRDHLFDVTRRLMRSISPAALQDPDRPVIVSVRGTLGRGKKIIPDAAREYMFDGEPEFEGRTDDYELWRGTHDGRDFEIDFLNIMHSTEFFADRAERNGIRLTRMMLLTHQTARNQFMDLRRHGGITFIHNDAVTQESADIDIRIESSSANVGYESRPTDLTAAFNTLSGAHDWARQVAIIVRDEDLMKHEPMNHFIDSLKLPRNVRQSFGAATELAARFAPELTTRFAARRNVPIFGVNIPRSA